MAGMEQCAYWGEDVATLGERIAVARENAGLDHEALAAALAVREGAVSDWEQDAAEPRPSTAQRLAGVLGVSLGWLLYGIGEGVPAPAEGEAAETHDLTERLLGELRETREMQERIGLRMARIEDALVSLKAA